MKKRTKNTKPHAVGKPVVGDRPATTSPTPPASGSLLPCPSCTAALSKVQRRVRRMRSKALGAYQNVLQNGYRDATDWWSARIQTLDAVLLILAEVE